MTRIRYGGSPWADAARRAVYPRLTGTLDIPVTIIGGGLTGAATAYAFAAAGIRVALLEEHRIGEDATSASPGCILAEPAGVYLEHEAAHGRRAARAVWQATRRAALDLSAAARRLRIRCALAPLDGVLYSRSSAETKQLQRELAARKAAGLEATWLTPRMLGAYGIDAAAGGIRTRGQGRVDPQRLCAGFLRAAAVRGAAIFENSAATRVVPRKAGLEIVTPRGAVRCETVVLATGDPLPAFRALDRHFTRLETYAVQTPPLPAAIRGVARDRGAVLQDREHPPHRLFWTAEDAIICSGTDQPRTPERGREKVLVQRTGQLMYELSLQLPAISGVQPERGWRVPYAVTADGLPFIGPHRNYPRHLFALGLGLNPAASFLAGRILLRQYSGQVEKADEYFGFARLAR
jgi:glycine/D-amino acid oxidase-like deaminating enzyme